MNSDSAIRIPVDSQFATAEQQPAQRVDLLLGHLTLSRGITTAYAGMYQHALERIEARDREIAELCAEVRGLKLAAANTLLDLTALLERARARRTYAQVDAELRGEPETLDDLQRAANTRASLAIELDCGTTAYVTEIGGAL